LAVTHLQEARAMNYSWTQDVLAVLSGGAVGFSLGLIGGGGSILAVPLLLYVVGIGDPHLAIGTSALAVAVNAFANLVGHWRAGNVKWPCAAIFAVSGAGNPDVRVTATVALRLVGIGLLVGVMSGFFGIGGGFLVVPGIMLGSGMPILNAIGSSLLSVGMFGLTTAANYALSGLIVWSIAGLFIAGGLGGGVLGMWSALHLAKNRRMLTYIFAAVVFAVAIYMLCRTGLPPFLSALLSKH
jgi:uncharacterized membrane protein YfcA